MWKYVFGTIMSHDQSMISFVNSDPAIKINTHFEQDIEIDFELLDM